LLTDSGLSQSIENLLNQETFLDNMLLQKTHLIDAKTIIMDELKFLSNRINAITDQFPVFLAEYNNNLAALLTQNFFSIWQKSIDNFFFDNFENLQNNFYKLSISLSGNTALLKSNFTNISDKHFLTNIANELLSKLSLEHQLLDNIYQLTNSKLIG
jgi:hypothetical protein